MRNEILCGDVLAMLATLPDESVHMAVTSPPYWGLRSYGTETWEGGDEDCDHKIKGHSPRPELRVQGLASWTEREYSGDFKDSCGLCGAVRIDKQLGLEPTPELYVEHMVAVFREVRRVLRRDGTLWLNLGDCYNAYNAASGPGGWKDSARDSERPHLESGFGLRYKGLKPKDLVGIPWRVAFALQADGWWLRSDIIWSKPNPMPESVTDRPTKAHEYVFLLSRSERYFYDAEAIKEAYSPSTIQRVNQANFDNQHGGEKDYGKTGQGIHSSRHALENLKQNLVGNRRYEGFSSRWDEAEAQSDIPTGRNARTVWEIVTEPFSQAHFATYPTELVKRCILAGSSEHGVCSVCGAPWVRVVEATKYTPPTAADGERFVDASRGDKTRKLSGADYNAQVSIRTLGWQPSCKHEAPIERALILDPFLGSGTTALVALRAGRDFIGIELNPAYVAMAEKRIQPYRQRLL